MDETPHFREGKDREDPRMWRLNQLPQTQDRHRSRLSLMIPIAVGLVLLATWLVLNRLVHSWALDVILAPVGGFILVWGVIQLVLAVVSHETLR